MLWKRGLYTWNWNVTDKFTSTNTLTCLHNFIDSNNDVVPNRWQVIIWTILDYGTSPVPSISNVTWRCRKNFSQWERCFHWKLPCHWLKFLQQRRIAVVILGPLSRKVQEYSKYKRLPSHSILRIFKPQGDICGYVQVQVQVLYWHIYIIKTQMTIDIAYKHTKCFGYNRDHMDNTLGLYIYANGARNHGWFMSPWVHIRNNEI